MDAFLFFIAPDGSLLDWNDDIAGLTNSNALIEGLVLPEDGIYHIEARSHSDEYAGAYTLIIEVAEEGEMDEG